MTQKVICFVLLVFFWLFRTLSFFFFFFSPFIQEIEEEEAKIKDAFGKEVMIKDF